MANFFSDSEIVFALKAGGKQQDDAIYALYTQNKSLLLGILRSSFKIERSKTPDDIIWETIEVFVSNVLSEKFSLKENTSISAYLRVVSKNIMMKYISSEEARSMREMSYGADNEYIDQDVSVMISESETWNRYLEIFEQIGKNCKRILQMVYGLGYSIKEMANVLVEEGLYENEQVVRNAKSKCLKNILTKI
ncbi:MAG: sigma-70 family RNA polymerase sigma factor [Cytophagaceae bacterium]|nr:sigma-70 family RNA polymerase sigma factor [Cytophagaceae bacterium]MBK9934657.1 sigma-70 family RNA polymerase sigma factor [Cytophagaceae bacterium]MBL0301094.1 sigma-70 family RNA polymerase sigma factor [Cytophagaceae bacterium]MBL0323912.1 sigma-70 family RNA polymerase sigma factor [Cytophagaceae bacterium]